MSERTATGDNVTESAALRVSGISKSFPGTRALCGVDFAVRRGEVHALLGHNGSGKSTLVKILAGIQSPDDGDGAYEVEGEPVAFGSPSAAHAAGVAFIHQELGLVDSMSVLENLRIGLGLYETGWAWMIRGKRERARVRVVLDSVGLHDVDPAVILSKLTPIAKTGVAIARAMQLADHVKVMVLDESTAALPDAEVERLFEIVRSLRDRGVGIIYVSHRLDEVFQIADRVTVLREGLLVAQRPVEGMTRTELTALILGHEVDAEESAVAAAPAQRRTPVLELRDAVAAEMKGATFAAYPGEVLGLAGLSGSGVHDLPRILLGTEPLQFGTVLVDGKPVPRLTPRELLRRGVAVLPVGRQNKSIVSMTLRENLTLPSLDAFWSGGLFRHGRERAAARQMLIESDVRPVDPERKFGTLSGGNQQKVLLAKWLRLAPKVLVLDEPTQGVDAAGRADIRQRLHEAAANDAAIVVCSSDLEDLEQLADRVLVFNDGRVTHELIGAEVDGRAIAALSIN